MQPNAVAEFIEGNPALSAIAEWFAASQTDKNLFLVGGAVRDLLLDAVHNDDFDLVYEGDAPTLAQQIFEAGISSIPPVVYPRFGTAMVRVCGRNVELVTARKESYDEASRKPDVEPATILEDARRRDFTVNTLLVDLVSKQLSDLLGSGVSDLENRVLRTPLAPEATFFDDPLRMLRAVRFRWRFYFEPAPGLYEAIHKESERLRIISFERIRDEFSKMLVLPDADNALEDLRQLELLEKFAPELLEMVDVEQGKFHHLDVWRHTLLVIRNAGPNDLPLALAALLHDVGKPRTRFIDENGDTRFFSHESVGAIMSKEILQRLKFSNEEIEQVTLLVKNHMRLGSAKVFSPTAARRVVRDLGDEVERLLALVEADANSLRPGVKALNLEPIRSQIERVKRETPRDQLESPLSGKQIMEALDLEAGPKVGEWKSWLTDQVLEGALAPGDQEGALMKLKLEASKQGA